jgi:hypothetical protein
VILRNTKNQSIEYNAQNEMKKIKSISIWNLKFLTNLNLVGYFTNKKMSNEVKIITQPDIEVDMSFIYTYKLKLILNLLIKK